MEGSNNITVLVVDDIADDRLITRMILEKYKFSVVEAESWKETLKKIMDGGISLVVLDVQMPEIDGVELIGLIRNLVNNSDVPVILYTSVTLNRSKKAEYESKGANAVVSKHDVPRMLVEKIKELLKTETA
jgi:two-component system chemotaxis response regulator CheY